MPKKTLTAAGSLGEGTPVKMPVSVATVGAARASVSSAATAAAMTIPSLARRQPRHGAVVWPCLGFDLMFLPFPIVGFILMVEEHACRLAVASCHGNTVPRASRRVETGCRPTAPTSTRRIMTPTDHRRVDADGPNRADWCDALEPSLER